MAESIVVAGIEIELTAFSELEPEVRGEEVRAFDNTLLDGTDAGRRRWEGTTDAMTSAASAALRVAVSAGPVVCSGLVLLGESVLARVRVGGAPRTPDYSAGRVDWTGVNVVHTLTLREV